MLLGQELGWVLLAEQLYVTAIIIESMAVLLSREQTQQSDIMGDEVVRTDTRWVLSNDKEQF